MKDRKELFLCHAHTRAARTGARCKVLAMKAGHEGRADLEAYFKAAAESYQIQARRLLLLLRGKIEPDMEQVLADFQKDLSSETMELQDMQAEAARMEDSALEAALGQAGQVLRGRGEFFRAAASGEDPDAEYLVCRICGCVVMGKAPDNCPVCQAVKDKFQKV